MLQILINFVFTAACLTLSLFLEEIAVIFAFFSALTGFLFLFYVPIYAGIQLPRLRTEYGYLDNLTGKKQPTDSISLALLSIFLGKSVSKVRKILYKKVVNPLEQGAVREVTPNRNDNYAEASDSYKQATITSDLSSSLLHEGTKVRHVNASRKFAGGFVIFIYALICIVAVIKNGMDMIQSF